MYGGGVWWGKEVHLVEGIVTGHLVEGIVEGMWWGKEGHLVD